MSRELIGLLFIPGAILGGILACSLVPRLRDLFFMAMIYLAPITEYYDINFAGRDWYRGTVRGFEFSLVDILAISLLVSGVLVRRDGHRRWYWPASFLLMLLFFFYSTFNVALSDPKLFGLYELSRMARCLVMFLAVAWFVQTERELKLLIFMLVVIVVYQGYVAVTERYLHGVHRVFGTFAHPNSLSVFFCLVTPLFIAALNSEIPKWLKLFCALAIPVACVSIVLTISRAGVSTLALVLAGVTLATMTWNITLRKIAVGLVVLVGVAGITAKSWNTLKARFAESNLEEEYENNRNQGRGYYIRIATAIVEERPFGVGLNNWSYWVSNKYGPKFGYRFVPYKGTDLEPSEEIPENSNVDAAQAAPAHSLLAITAGELGLPGLFLLALLWLRWFQMAFSFIWRRTPDPMRRMGIGILFGFAGLFLQSLTEWVFRQSAIAYVFHIELGALASLYYIKRRQRIAERAAAEESQEEEWELLQPAPNQT
jgi:hypothetical protein